MFLRHDRAAHHHHNRDRLIDELLEHISWDAVRVPVRSGGPQQLGALSLERQCHLSRGPRSAAPRSPQTAHRPHPPRPRRHDPGTGRLDSSHNPNPGYTPRAPPTCFLQLEQARQIHRSGICKAGGVHCGLEGSVGLRDARRARVAGLRAFPVLRLLVRVRGAGSKSSVRAPSSRSAGVCCMMGTHEQRSTLDGVHLRQDSNKVELEKTVIS